MTALKEYQRLEATGLWRDTADTQRREVVVSIGDATLVMSDMADQPLTHWSLAAISRSNPGKMPAIFHPDGDTAEQLELGEDAREMVTAIEKLQNAIDRSRPRPGRLRLVTGGLIAAAITGLAVFWLPGALRDQAVSVVPMAKRVDIGRDLVQRMERITGPACDALPGQRALKNLSLRLPDPSGEPSKLLVVRDGVRDALALPGNHILINAGLIEDYEDPDIVAGHVLAAQMRAAYSDPLERLLEVGGVRASFQLLTTGTLPDQVLQSYAETLPNSTQVDVPDELLLQSFKRAKLRATPYAYSLDVTGEKTLHLIEADPYANKPVPRLVLTDNDWLRLQAICGN